MSPYNFPSNITLTYLNNNSFNRNRYQLFFNNALKTTAKIRATVLIHPILPLGQFPNAPQKFAKKTKKSLRRAFLFIIIDEK